MTKIYENVANLWDPRFFLVFSQGRPIAKYQKKTGVPKVYVSLPNRFALCRLRISLARKPLPASTTRARLAPVLPAGSGQTRHVDGPPWDQHYGYLAG